jgi:hypothetical protein
MRITSGGNVLVGNSTTPSAASANAPALLVSGPNDATIQLSRENATAGGGAIQSAAGAGLVFYTHTGAVGSESYSERIRIDGSGKISVNTSAVAGSGWVQINAVTADALAMRFKHNGGTVGSINTTSSSTSYNTSSDYRLKENAVDMTDAIARVKNLQPKRFNFIADDTDTLVDGFMAHEAQTVVPEAVTGTKDAMRDEEYEVSVATGDIYTPEVAATYDEDGFELTAAIDEVIHSADVERPEELAEGQQWRETTAAVMGTRSVPDYQGIDQAKLVPLLTGALQEAIAKIEALEARVTALEGV